MIATERTCEDVYVAVMEQSEHTQSLVFWCMIFVILLCLLILADLIAKLFVNWSNLQILGQNRQILSANAAHGYYTDGARKDIQEAAAHVHTEGAQVAEIKEAVKVVDQKVTALVEEKTGSRTGMAAVDAAALGLDPDARNRRASDPQ